jgi:thiamine pyrophosphokinase
VRKDRTDGELAVAEALRRGAGELVLAGALGALDHVLGHLAVLADVEAGGTPARLVAPSLTVRVLVAPARARLDAARGTRVSLVAVAGDAMVSLRGFDYELEHGRLPAAACLGLGNAVAAGRAGAAEVTVHAGRVGVLVFSGAEAFAGLRRLPGLEDAHA